LLPLFAGLVLLFLSSVRKLPLVARLVLVLARLVLVLAGLILVLAGLISLVLLGLLFLFSLLLAVHL
jgi:hypothetical protein